MGVVQKKSNRNSVLELLRLCASLWVMYYHGFTLIERTQYFSNGRIAVDFFFLLSGFFFITSYQKEKNKTTGKGLLSFIWKKFKPLSITFCICMIFSVKYYIEFYEGFFQSSIWGFLWYVPHLMIVYAFFFFLRRRIKPNVLFYIITAIISAGCYALILTYTTDYGVYRGIAGVGLGILLSKIPKPSCKWFGFFSAIITGILFATINFISIFYPKVEWEDPIFLLVLFPLLIYFASNIRFSNKIINKACSISFELYAYQAILRYWKATGAITQSGQMFLLILILAIIDVTVKSIFRWLFSKRNTDKTVSLR